MYDIEKLNHLKVADLREIAKELDIKKTESLKKQDLVYRILDEQAEKAASAPVKSEKPKSSDSNYENWPKQLVLFDCCSSNYWSTCRKQDWRPTIQAFQTTRPLTRFFIF